MKRGSDPTVRKIRGSEGGTEQGDLRFCQDRDDGPRGHARRKHGEQAVGQRAVVPGESGILSSSGIPGSSASSVAHALAVQAAHAGGSLATQASGAVQAAKAQVVSSHEDAIARWKCKAGLESNKKIEESLARNKSRIRNQQTAVFTVETAGQTGSSSTGGREPSSGPCERAGDLPGLRNEASQAQQRGQSGLSPDQEVRGSTAVQTVRGFKVPAEDASTFKVPKQREATARRHTFYVA